MYPPLNNGRHQTDPSRPNAIVDETEEVPFGRSFSLEIPEDPTIDTLLVGIHLSLDIVPCSILKRLRPLIDEILIGTGTDIVGGFARFRESTIVSCTDTVSILYRSQ